jgi:SulP family sulfate permease
METPSSTRAAVVDDSPGARVECVREEGLRFYASRPLALFRSVRREDVTPDLVAGLTVAAVAIPQAIAYASIAELPPHYGLYTAAVAAIVGSLWGCSRFLATGPVNAVSLLVLPALLAVAVPGSPAFLTAASTVAIMAGVFSLVLAAMRFGALVTLASRSVLLGFTAGAAIHIAVGQVKHLLGIDISAMPELHRTVSAIFAAAGDFNPVTLALGLGTVVSVLSLRRIGPRVPAALLTIVIAALAVWAFGLEERGVRVVGRIARSLPPPTWVSTGMLPDLQMIRGLVTGAMAVAALGLIEAVAASQTLARRSGDRMNANQEFFGQGLANVAAGLFSGYPCSGSFTRSALAQQSGARTHLTGVFTGLTILLGVLLFAPYAARIPRAAIAGVLLVVAWRMIDREGIRRVLRTSKAESAIVVITFCATLVFPLDFAVLAGVLFSLAFFVIRSSLPRVVQVVPDPTYRHLIHNPELPVCPQLGILNIRGPLFFGAVHHVEEELRHNRQRHPGQIYLVLRMHGVDICDLTGIEMLESTVKEYRQVGGDVFLVRPRRPVLKVMEKSGFLDDTLGRDHVLAQEGAIEYLFEKMLDPTVCIYECEHRVFAECQALEKHPYDVRLPRISIQPHAHDRLVTPERFEQLASDTEALVIDVREPEEYRRGHVPGAALLPLRALLEEGPDLPKDKQILLVCRSGRRTTRAIYMLEDLGFTRLHGLEGGILAWQAEGLPLSHSADGQPATPEASRQRRVLAMLKIKRRSEELYDRIELLAKTDDLTLIRESLERSLESSPSPELLAPGCVRLDPERPVLIVSEFHAQRRAFHKLLSDRYTGENTNLESLVQGDLQFLLLGDVLHSDRRDRWEEIREEFATRFAPSRGEIGPTPSMDREMADAFGLAAMIMTLQSSVAGVHCLKGNHDNVLNSDEHGNIPIAGQGSWPGEGEATKLWTQVRFGAGFAGKYAAWENRLPVFAIYDNGEEGLKFVASHTEPASAYSLKEIERRTDEVVSGLTWTRNEGTFAPDVLRDVFGSDWSRARYFVSHTGSQEGIIHFPRNRLVIIDKSLHLVAAVVRPRRMDFEVHIVSGA